MRLKYSFCTVKLQWGKGRIEPVQASSRPFAPKHHFVGQYSFSDSLFRPPCLSQWQRVAVLILWGLLLPASHVLAAVQCLVLCEERARLGKDAHCASLVRASVQDIWHVPLAAPCSYSNGTKGEWRGRWTSGYSELFCSDSVLITN